MKTLRKKMSRVPFLVAIYMFVKKLVRWPGFFADWLTFRGKKTSGDRFSLRVSDIQPCLLDKTANTVFEPHYIYHPAWAVRAVREISPKKHIDISSTLHFSAMLSAFIPVDFYDYRPAPLKLSGLTCKSADLNDLPFANNSIESLSCMHTIEHVGLGRYGDRIDPDGDLRAAKELARVVAEGGNLLMVVPVGKPKLCFNAHRIYLYDQLIGMFPGLKVKSFSLVPDDYANIGMMHGKEAMEAVSAQDWGCGCFWFIKEKQSL